MLQRIAYIALGLMALLIAVELAYVARMQRPSDQPVIRIGCASWQKGEMPFESFIAAYEALHPDVRIQVKVMPPEDANKLMMLWREGRTPYDLVIAFANEEIFTYIEMGVLEDVRTLLSPEQVDEFLPAGLDGCTVPAPDGQPHTYMIPFTIEMMCLNVRQDILSREGITQLPATYAELEAMARGLGDLRDSSGRKVWPIAVDFSQYFFFGQNSYVPMLADFTDGCMTDARGRLDVSSPAAAKVFTALRRWYRDGLASNSSTILQQADRDFQAGLGVIYPHWQSRGPLVLAELRKVNPNVDVAIYPAPGADRAGSLVSSYGAIIPVPSPNKKLAARVAYDLLSHWAQPSVVATGKLPPVKSVYDHGFDKDPEWLRELRRRYADVPASRRPAWLQEIENTYAAAALPDWMLRLRPSLLKGYTFPDVIMWPKIYLTLAITFQEWLGGVYGEDVSAAMAKLQERVDAQYRRAAAVREALAARTSRTAR